MNQEKLRSYIAGLDRLLENVNADPKELAKIKLQKLEALKRLGVEEPKIEDEKKIESEEPKAGFVCVECGKILKSNAGLVTHSRSHAKVNPVPADSAFSDLKTPDLTMN